MSVLKINYLQLTQAVPVPRKNAFVELDTQLLERIELMTEEIARNSTKEFVDHEIQAMIDLFVNNLNITIDDVRRLYVQCNCLVIGASLIPRELFRV